MKSHLSTVLLKHCSKRSKLFSLVVDDDTAFHILIALALKVSICRLFSCFSELCWGKGNGSLYKAPTKEERRKRKAKRREIR